MQVGAVKVYFILKSSNNQTTPPTQRVLLFKDVIRINLNQIIFTSSSKCEYNWSNESKYSQFYTRMFNLLFFKQAIKL